MADALAIINKIAEVSSAVGWQAGVDATGIAGMIVSVLHAHPELVDRFVDDGVSLLHSDDHYRTFRTENGSLSYTAMNGRIMTPAELRASKGLVDQ